MLLKELNVEDGTDIYEMLQKIGSNENAFKNEVNGMTYEEYEEWLLKQKAWSEGKMLPPGYVKQWTFWLYDNSEPIGYGKLREKVTEQSRNFGGNLGFAIVPEKRGMGCGTFLFKELLTIAKEKSIKELYSTVEKYNYASKTVHEKVGGVLVEENAERWVFRFKL